MDYLIVTIIALAAAWYIFRHFRAKLTPPDGVSGCPGCGGSCGGRKKGESNCDEQPFVHIENGNKNE